MSVKEDFSKKIKELRSLKGLTQATLAEAAKCSHSTIRDYENHITFPGPDMLENLAIALGVGISDLFVKKETAIKDMPVSHTLKKMLSIPDEVYEMASRLEGAHKKRAWEGIEGILSGAIAAQEEEVKNRSHSS